jgi:activator of Hsp90 ATPase-like protein
VTEPLRFSFDVGCPVEHAFGVWTGRINLWWPADHTVSGHPDTEVVLEPRLGGRIFERTADGVEHEWGEVTLWEPPHRLGYLWHLRTDRSAATEVEIRFIAATEASTRIEIEHAGWERLGDAAPQWRDRNRMGWATLFPHFKAAARPG